MIMRANTGDINEELSCPICMCMFQSPITIECGHSFCRSCLLNYTRSKQMCPICRVILTQICEHPPEDQVLTDILDLFKEEKEENGQIKGDMAVTHFEDLIVIDIKTKELLLPFTKATVTFCLPNAALLGRLDRFVARQEAPFHKYGVVSKIIYINHIRYNTYECSIECKSFCEISKEQIEKNCDQTEEYFYKVCQARIIYEFDHVDPCTLQHFLTYFQTIKDRSLLANIERSVDHEKMFSKSNLIACFYSILKIMARSKEAKYKIAISFDKQTKENFLKEFLNGISFDVSRNVNKFLDIQAEKGHLLEVQFIGLFLILVSFFLLWNQEEF